MAYEQKPGSTASISSGGQYDDVNTTTNVSYQQLAAEEAAAAELAATQAQASATAAASSASSALSSANSATASASTATSAATTATNAATSATNSATTATSASGVATTKAAEALASATSASTSASNASTSASNASTSATNASNSASSASSSANTATTQANLAFASATTAGTSATSAGISASNAATSASQAEGYKNSALSYSGSANLSAIDAQAYAVQSASSASGAATSASNASASAATAVAAKDAALAAFDNFDDRYLGPKASDPTVDNDGNPLITGALYFNTTSNVMKVYEGTMWVAAYVSAAGALMSANNLSDVADVSTSRTNLGLGSIATQGANAVAITGGTIDNTVIGGTTPAAGTFTTLTATGTSYLGGSSTSRNVQVDPVAGGTTTYTQFTRNAGINEQQIVAANTANLGLISTGGGTINFYTASNNTQKQLVVANTGSAVNYVQVTGSSTTNWTAISAQGSDTNVSLASVSKGTGALIFSTNGASGNRQFQVSGTVTAPINYLQASGSVTASGPILSSQGSDTNIDLNLTTKGTGAVNLNTANGTAFKATEYFLSGSAVNYIFAAGRQASNPPVLGSAGSDTNVSLAITSKGTGSISFTTSNGGLNQFQVAHTASAVNYVQVTGAATGLPPTISAQGSDAAPNLAFITKSTGAFNFYNQNGYTSRQFRIDGSVATAVNYLQVAGASTTQSPVFSSQGPDTNISQVFQSKGTGAIDLAAGSSGVNISNGGTVTAITNTGAGTYTSFPTVAISAPTTAGGVQATVSVATMYFRSVAIQSGGTGYTVGNVLSIVGGTPTGATATATVTSVSAGVITGISVTTGSTYSALPTNPASVTGGTGTGATLNLSWGTVGFTITNAGSGYVEQPTVSFSGGGGSGAAAYATVGSGTVVKSIGSTMSFYTPEGEAIRVSGNGGTSANYLVALSGISGVQPQLRSTGEANTNLLLGSNGTGAIRLTTQGGTATEQFRVAHTASAVNYVQVTGAATTNFPTLSAQGSDTNIGLTFASKGTQAIRFNTNSTDQQFRIAHTGGTSNYIQVTGSVASSAPSLSSQGSDTNIDLNLTTKGTGAVNLNTGNGIGFRVYDGSGGSPQVNYFQARARGTGAGPFILPDGADTNISANFGSKGTGSLSFLTNGASLEQLRVSHTASAVNYVNITGAATGVTPVIFADGSDSQISLLLRGKGSASGVALGTSFGNYFRAVGFAGSTVVNNLQAQGSATTISPVLSAQGSDTNISQVFQSKGTGAIDLAAGSSGVNISNGGTVTALTRTSSGGGYTSIPAIAISAPTTAGGVQATANANVFVQAVSIVSGGTGYTAGDTLTLVGGTFAAASLLTVNTVSAGVITGVTVLSGGSAYTAIPTNPVSVTGGTGSGATFNVTAWGVAPTFTITNAGSGYVEQPTVTFSGGGGSGAAAYATVGSGTVVRSIGSNLGLHTPSGLQLLVNDGGGNGANYWRFSGAGTNSGIQVLANGSDTNVSALYSTKGASAHTFYTNNFAQTQFNIAHTASAVNYVQVTGAATGVANGPTISTQGSDTNISLALTSKGTGSVRVTNSGSVSNPALCFSNTNRGFYDPNTGEIGVVGAGWEQFRFGNTASAVNYLKASGSATGSAPSLVATGSDTNIPLVLQPKGTGALQAQQTDSTATGGNARGANAVDWQTSRSAASQVATTFSVISGGSNNTAAGYGSVAAGGIANTSSGGYSFIGAGLETNARSGYSSVVSGFRNNAAGHYGFIGSGYSNTTTSNAVVTTQSGTMNGTTAVTLSGSNANIKVGQLIAGTSILTYPNDTYVAAISGTSLTLSQAASGSSTSTLSFYTPHGVVVGGGNNQATGSYSFIGGGGDAGTASSRNTTSGDWSVVVGGRANTASGISAFVGGGGVFSGAPNNNYPNTASGTSSAVVGGLSNTASGQSAFIGAGYSNTANSTYGTIAGGTFGTTRGIAGNNAIACCNAPFGGSSGIIQTATLLLGRQTTDATATVLTSDASAASTTNQVILPNNSAYYFRGEVVAGVTGGGNTKGWTIEGVIKRGANAASTALVGTPTVTSSYADAGASTWTIAVSADTTNGGLAVTFTGQAATTIRCVAQIRTTEMTY